MWVKVVQGGQEITRTARLPRQCPGQRRDVYKWAGGFYFGGTSLMIIVSVTMDTVTQVQSHLLAHQYEGLIRKARVTSCGLLTPRSSQNRMNRTKVEVSRFSVCSLWAFIFRQALYGST